MGGDKLWLDVAGRPLLRRAFDALAAAQLFEVVVVACDLRWSERITEAAAAAGLAAPTLVGGGERRQDSVRAGLAACGEAELVCVHDAARPLCPPALFGTVVEAARRHGAATTVIPVVDSVKEVDSDGRVVRTVERSALVAVQTPQAFSAALLRRAHERALREGWQADDDCALVERLGAPVVTVPGDPRNLKVTRPADLAVALAQLEAAR